MPNKKRVFRSYNPAFGKFTPGQKDRKRSITIHLGTVSGSITKDIFRAQSEVLIDQISVISTVAVAANINSFYKFDLQNASKGAASIFTQTGNTIPDTSTVAIAANTSRDLYNDASVEGAYFLAPNDVLQLVLTKVGFPTNLQDLVVQIEYEITGYTTTTSTSTTSTTSTTTSSSTSSTTTTTTTTSTTTTIT